MSPNYDDSGIGELRPILFEMSDALRSDDINGAMARLKVYLLSVPYCRDTNNEGHYRH